MMFNLRPTNEAKLGRQSVRESHYERYKTEKVQALLKN